MDVATLLEQNTINKSDEAFASLGLDVALVAAVFALGYEEPTAVQRESIPPLLAGHDILAQAATGTGKTAAFALPLIHRIKHSGGDRSKISGLILVPTRELAMQVAEALHIYGRSLAIRVLPIYGGQSMPQQLRGLKRGVDIVVATPGRAIDHLRRGTLRLDATQTVVLDEADEMLDMGFADDLEILLAAVPSDRQIALFSATMPKRIELIAKKHLRDPVRVTIAHENVVVGEKARVREAAFIVQRRHKITALARLLDMEDPTSVILFCRTRLEVDEFSETLNAHGYEAEALHGGLSQEQRDRVLRRFREGVSDILVATDVAARGLDIDHLSHVVNFEVPSSPEVYVHRIGRTGRAGREGVAITLVDPRELRLLRNIEQHTKRKIALEPVPTVHDLHARRLELTRTALEQAIIAGELDRYRRVVEQIAEEYDIFDVAAAALKLMEHARQGAMEDTEIPIEAVQEAPIIRGRNAKTDDPNITRLYINVGRKEQIKPGDLVRAISDAAHIDARAVGTISIADMYSLVEVPAQLANTIISGLRGATLRGRKVSIRKDRGPAGKEARP